MRDGGVRAILPKLGLRKTKVSEYITDRFELLSNERFP